MSIKKSIKIQNNLTCDLSGNICNNRHILRKPRKLPCGRTVCLECAEALADAKNLFNCSFCKLTHSLVRDLDRNMMAEYALDENVADLCVHFLDELRKSCLRVKQVRMEKKETLVNVIEFIRHDITVRVESVDVELEKLRIGLYSEISKRAEQNFRISEIKFKKFQNQQRGQKHQDLIRFYEGLSRQLETIQKYICDDFSLIKTSKVNPASIFGTKDIIGELKWIDKNVYNLEKIFQPSTARLKFHPYDISGYLGDKFIVTDKQNNCLYVLNSRLNHVLMRVDRLSGRDKLFQPTSVLVDQKDEIVYLSCAVGQIATDEREVLVIDLHLTRVLHVIPNVSSDDFRLTSESRLLLFDSCGKSVLEFCFKSKVLRTVGNLDLENEINATANDLLFGVSFTDQLIAVNVSNKLVNIYDFKSCQLNSRILIEPEDGRKVYGIYLEKQTSRLFIHLNDADSNSLIQCYEKQSGVEDWTCVFERPLPNVGTGSWRMRFLSNECLVLTLWSQNLSIF